MTYLHVLDLVLLALATARATRLVTTDSLGQWWIHQPANNWVDRDPKPWKYKLTEGLSCPFCVGFWIGTAALATLALAGGPGHAHELWRYAAAAFALNYLTGHASSRLD